VSRAVALAAALALALAGCGDDTAPTTDPAASTDLTVTLDVDGPGAEAAKSATVSCPGDEAAACDAIAGLPADPAAPTPPDTACTEIFGGPEVVTVHGTLEGEPVNARLTRANGCEIDRFDPFVPLLTDLFPGYTPGQALP